MDNSTDKDKVFSQSKDINLEESTYGSIREPNTLNTSTTFNTPSENSCIKKEDHQNGVLKIKDLTKGSREQKDQEIVDTPKSIRSCMEKLSFILSRVVVEPFYILFMFSYFCKTNLYTNLVKDKVCLFDLNYPKTICDHLHKYTREEIEVQKMTNNISLGHSLIVLVPAAVIGTFIGSFADKYGRKVPLILASTGLLLEIIGIVLCVLNFNSRASLLLLTAIPGGIAGGIIVITTVIASYLSEVSSSENRTLRLAFLDIVLVVAIPVGTAYGGAMFEMFVQSRNGYLFVFSSSFFSLLLATIWIFFRLKEPEKEKMGNWRQVLRDLTSLENVKENIRTSTKKREGNIKTQLWLLFISMAVIYLCNVGTMNIGFIFVMKMYDWNIKKYSLVSTYTSLSQGVTLCIAIPLLTKVMKANDCILIIIGTFFTAANFSLKAFAYQEWMYYLGCLSILLSGLGSVGIRSRLSKLVQKDEFGKAFSSMATLESITPVIGLAIFAQLYNASLDFFPGLAYLIAAILLIIPFAMAIYIFKKSPGIPNLDITEEATTKN